VFQLICCFLTGKLFFYNYIMANMKMTATASKQGFTLVELIVVITILAILGTIGFISLQGYSAQSRDSKRSSDLKNLTTLINTKNVSGLGLIPMVTADATRVVTSPSFGWSGGTLGTDYQAGSPNNTVLGVSADTFKDPSVSVPYALGATTRVGGAFELATKYEAGDVPTAYVTGNYTARTASGVAVTTTAGSKTITLPASAVGLFKKGDAITSTSVLTGGATGADTILNISSDGLTLTVGQVTLANGEIVLAGTESSGLIGTSGGVAVTNNSVANLPY
jgi:prepilin-type N-terminal cleavage/methylation domain-containing protein